MTAPWPRASQIQVFPGLWPRGGQNIMYNWRRAVRSIVTTRDRPRRWRGRERAAGAGASGQTGPHPGNGLAGGGASQTAGAGPSHKDVTKQYLVL